jgi:hypothetical protein
MTGKQSDRWSGLGSTLRGAAALVTACAGGVALFYFARDTGQSEVAMGSEATNQSESKAPGPQSDGTGVSEPVPGDVSLRAWRPDAIAARRDMFDARRLALSVKCHKNRPEAYALGEITQGKAEEDFKAERYSIALESFRRAAAQYRECGEAE